MCNLSYKSFFVFFLKLNEYPVLFIQSFARTTLPNLSGDPPFLRIGLNIKQISSHKLRIFDKTD